MAERAYLANSIYWNYEGSMSQAPKYPTFTDASLVPFRALELQLKEFPDILDRPDCPYPPHIRLFLRRLVTDPGTPAARVASYGEDDLLQEITDLYEDLKRASLQVNTNDAKDKIAMLKTSADLLTRMVDLKGKALNQREMARFQKTVVEILETIVTPAQRAEFIEKMGSHLNVQ